MPQTSFKDVSIPLWSSLGQNVKKGSYILCVYIYETNGLMWSTSHTIKGDELPKNLTNTLKYIQKNLYFKKYISTYSYITFIM